MDKNSIIGFSLIALILIGYSIYSQPSAEEQRRAYVQDSLRQEAQKAAEQKAKLAETSKKTENQAKAMADTTALFYGAMTGKDTVVTLKNEKVQLTLSAKGATVTQAELKNYKDHIAKDKNVTLFRAGKQALSYTLATKEQNISTADLFFKPTNVTDSTVTFVADAGAGRALYVAYELGSGYLLDTKVWVEGLGGLFASGKTSLNVAWEDMCPQQEKGFTFENRYATLTYHYTDGGAKHLSEGENEQEEVEEPIDWIAFKNQFFSAVMISKDGFARNAKLMSSSQEKGSGFLKQYNAEVKVPFDPTGKQPTALKFYYGPNDYRLLNNLPVGDTFGKDLQLERLVDLGWPIIRWINRWFTLYVFDWLSQWFPMGVVLILITLLLKGITYPMVKKSYMSSAKMRVLKPKIDAATSEFNKPEDQMKKQSAMMSEYAKYGVSPLSGCLPMLIQMPIWIAMFNFVPNAIQLRGQSFLWMKDLSTYDPIFEWGHNYWLIGDHLSLTCILFCGAQLLYSWFTMQQQKDQMVGQQAEQMKVMQWMMFAMPLFFFFMFNDYSSGLNFYYFVSLFFSAAIMYVLRKTTNDEKLLAILEAKYKENQNNPQKMSGLMARMQALQQMQQEKMNQQRRNK